MSVKLGENMKNMGTIQKSRYKIEYLHKMLDNEIHTVNTMFQRDNGFEQIEAKLK